MATVYDDDGTFNTNSAAMENGKRYDLDDLVHDYFSAKASDLNNEGAEAQVEFLIEHGVLEPGTTVIEED